MLMSIALNEDKRLVNISQVKRGLQCQCFCFECGEPVIARKGEKNEHHFAHTSNKDSCFISPETVLHKFAKQVISENKTLTLPAFPDGDNQEPKNWHFSRVIQEQAIGSIRPDLVTSAGDDIMFIEIAVTSFVDSDKLALIKQLGIHTIEIDLRDLINKDIEIPSDEAKQYILTEVANKRWIYPETKPLLPSENIESLPISLSCPTNLNETINTEQNIFDRSYTTYRFTIMHSWIDVRVFNSGMVSVKCVSYNHEIIQLLKLWRNEGGGKYSQKYKSWNYFKPFSDIVLKRLQEMDMTPTT